MDQTAPPHRHIITGDAQLDVSHRALQANLACCAAASDARLATSFGELVDSLERQFRHEESLMEIIELPALHAHREQHMRVLSALRLAESALPAEPWLARHALDLLEDWLELHAQTQDTVLAVALELASTPPGNVS
jgi:hemerythrin-like metal-binding protein